MYCKSCGKQIPDESDFCKYCGTVLSSQGAVSQSDPEPTFSEERKKKGFSKWLLLIPVAVLLVVAAVVIAILLGNRNRIDEAYDPNEAYELYSEQIVKTGQRDPSQMIAPASKEDSFEKEDTDVSIENSKDTNETESEETAVEDAVPEEPTETTYIEKQIRLDHAAATSYCTARSKDGQTYEPYHTVDGDYTTAWLEGKDGLGIGESLTFDFDKAERISRLVIYNGFLNTKYRYAINGKVTQLSVEFDDGIEHTFDLTVIDVPEDKVPFNKSEMSPTEIVFDEPITSSRMKLTIEDAVAGSKYDDVSISEVELYQEIPE